MDITLEELINAIEDETLKAWWTAVKELPEEFSINEFFVKCLDAAAIAAARRNETLEPGQKILGYPPAANGAIAQTKTGQLYFPRTSTVSSFVVVPLDGATPTVG
jgi:hypothetical protein